jgi:hypothetical protein
MQAVCQTEYFSWPKHDEPSGGGEIIVTHEQQRFDDAQELLVSTTASAWDQPLASQATCQRTANGIKWAHLVLEA